MVVVDDHAHVALDRQGSCVHARQLAEADPLRRRRAHSARQQSNRAWIRGPVVGRRNHFGSKSRRGTEVATLYTIVETAKLHDIDPAAYLHAAIVAADRGELLLPAEFAAQRAAGAE